MAAHKIVVARIFDQFDGREPWRAGVITRLDREKFETVCIFLVKKTEEENYFSKLGYKVFYLSDEKVRSLSPSCIYRVAKILRNNKVDIVHCHRHKCTVIGTLASMLASVPIVISQVHNVNRTRTVGRRVMNYFLFKRINKIIAVGKGVEDDVLSSNYAVPAHKVSAEGNSVDYERFANAPVNRRQAREQFELSPEAFVFGTVGRMMPDKGQKYLISAFSTVKKINPSACLIMVGYGQLRAELERQARETGFADSIFFTGYKKDVAQVLPAMDAFVLASFSEGIPRVLMEAMSAGIPCIATNISGNPEVIDDGISGLLVPPKDVNSMADAMIKMIQMPPSERNNMIEAARQKIMKSFNHQNIANQVEKLYEDEFHKANLQKN